MKATKKVRTRTEAAAKVKKKATKSTLAIAKTKTVTEKGKTSKTVKTKSSPRTEKTKSKKSSMVKATSAGKKTMTDKRKPRTLSPKEYDAFVTKTAKKEKVKPEELVTLDRRAKKASEPSPAVAMEKEKPQPKVQPKTERRPKVQRRRQIDPTTCERDYTQEEIEFMSALDEYKRNSGRMFPTCSEILEVFRGLGYMKQSHEETIEIEADPKSGDVYVTATETGTMTRSNDFDVASNGETGGDKTEFSANMNEMSRNDERSGPGFPFLTEGNESPNADFPTTFPFNATPYFL